MHVYPDVEAVRTVIWMPRIHHKTRPVEFTRDGLPNIETRIRSAVGEWHRWHDKPPEECPRWPTIEKCRICPAAPLCPPAGAFAQQINADPGAFVDTMCLMDAWLEAATETATEWSDTYGTIKSKLGNQFGRDAPRAERRPDAKLYAKKAD
jgi:hypothetical protein